MASTYEIVNVGLLPNDGEGDPLRVAFQKINNNFANLFAVTTSTSESYSVGNTAQVILAYPSANFTHATFQIRSSNPATNDIQDITIQAQINNSNTDVKFSAYGTTFFGNALCNYNMGILAGNVVIYADPLANTTLLHFITSSITWAGEPPPGLLIELDGYAAGSVMSTENQIDITTELPL